MNHPQAVRRELALEARGLLSTDENSMVDEQKACTQHQVRALVNQKRSAVDAVQQQHIEKKPREEERDFKRDVMTLAKFLERFGPRSGSRCSDRKVRFHGPLLLLHEFFELTTRIQLGDDVTATDEFSVHVDLRQRREI